MIQDAANRRAASGSRRHVTEWIAERIIFLSGILSIIIVLGILALLLRNTFPLFHYTSVSHFLFGADWYPLSGRFGILALILGSLWVTAGAIAIAVPLGIGTAIYIGELSSPRAREILKPLVELLAAVPSVVWGFIGMLVLGGWVKAIFNLNSGLTALTASATLAFMSLPTIVSISEDALRAVPNAYREASLSLGATEWQTIRRSLLPAASSGIIAAIMLGIGRAIGETMAVLMVAGNSIDIPRSFLQPVSTLTARIAAEMGETVQGSDHYFALFGIGTVLFAITFIVNSIADLALRRTGR